MKREAFDHPKLRRLQVELGLERWQAVGLLESLWRMAERFAKRGDIGRFSDQEIADWIDWRADSVRMLCALCAAGFVDASNVHRYVIHDWSEHAEDSVHVYLARHGLLFADDVPPKLNRLSKQELEEYEKAICAHKKRTRSAHSAPKKRISANLVRGPQPQPPTGLKEGEEHLSVPVSVGGNNGRDQAKKNRRSHRVPDEFVLTAELLSYATGEGLSEEQARREFAKLRDCEFKTPHQDWPATWRNWVRRAADLMPPNKKNTDADKPPHLRGFVW